MASAEPGKPERRAPRRAGAAVRRRRPLRGEFSVPGDKSISHRAVLLAAIAGGKSRIQGFSPAEDCRASLALVRQLGCRVATRPGGELAVTGLAPGAAPPDGSLTVDCGRSGTTMRLGLGLLAAQPINCVMTGHPQLLARPMARVVDPLRAMGARISMSPTGTAPLEVTGGGLLGITYTPPRASAQVKSALLLAGLGAGSVTTVVEPNPTRDHTERLLLAMGAQLTVSRSGPGLRLRLRPGPLAPLRLRVPGDPSSAAVLAAAAALVPGSDVTIREVGVNPSRMGFFRVLARMGATVDIEPVPWGHSPEPVGSIRVRQADLGAYEVGANEVPELIDELPLLGLLGCAAEGVSRVGGAAELRVKESDRIHGLVGGLQALGAECEELPDGFIVRGPVSLRGGDCDALGDHRLAMTLTLAQLISRGPVRVAGGQWVADSFPGFTELWGQLL